MCVYLFILKQWFFEKKKQDHIYNFFIVAENHWSIDNEWMSRFECIMDLLKEFWMLLFILNTRTYSKYRKMILSNSNIIFTTTSIYLIFDISRLKKIENQLFMINRIIAKYHRINNKRPLLVEFFFQHHRYQIQ